MRNLQKLHHARPVPPAERPALEAAASERVARREWHIWLRRAKRLALLAGVVGIGWAALALVTGMRRTADGLVVANRVRVTAPGPVRVAEVLVEANQACRRGQPLLRLEPAVEHPERQRLLAVVRTKRARVAWFDGGGEVEELGRTLRVDLVAEARRQAGEADAERALAEARLASLLLEREGVVLELMEESERRHGEVAALVKREELAAALVAEADANLRLAAFDAGATQSLRGAGIVAEREAVSRRTQQDAASSSVEALVASGQALRRELEVARLLAERFDGRVPTTIAHLDARIEVARSEIAAAERGRQQWLELFEHHRGLDTEEVVDAERVRSLRRGVLEGELLEAQAQLAVFDFQQGRRTIEAQVDGYVDQVLVSAGDVVAAESELAVYHDPRTLRVVGYVTPELLPSLALGGTCRIALEGDAEPLEGRISAIGATWVPCPPSLPRRLADVVDLRIPVEVSCAVMDRVERLAPNMRLKVTFARGRSAGLLQRLFGT